MGKKQDKFEDYEGFVEKFKPKKTTDDCYTPPNHIYNAVKQYVMEKFDLHGMEVVRPFWPGGDYERQDYPEGCVVIDNPPFSMISDVVRFFAKRRIPFFLFAPSLTLFIAHEQPEVSYFVTNATITYENGAKVNTSFVSNLPSQPGIFVAGKLQKVILDTQRDFNRLKRRQNVHYNYPSSLVTAASLHTIAGLGDDLFIDRRRTHFIRALQSMRAQGKGCFGGAFLVDSQTACMLDRQRKSDRAENAITWDLSEEEENIIKQLDDLKL